MTGRKKQTSRRGVKAKAKVYVVSHGPKEVNQARVQLQRQKPQRADAVVQQLVTLFTPDGRDPHIVRRKINPSNYCRLCMTMTMTMTMKLFYLTIFLLQKKTLYRINVTFIQVIDWSGDYY